MLLNSLACSKFDLKRFTNLYRTVVNPLKKAKFFICYSQQYVHFSCVNPLTTIRFILTLIKLSISSNTNYKLLSFCMFLCPSPTYNFVSRVFKNNFNNYTLTLDMYSERILVTLPCKKDQLHLPVQVVVGVVGVVVVGGSVGSSSLYTAGRK
jgi:hypothetical protein